MNSAGAPDRESAGVHIIMDARVADAAVFTPGTLTGLFERLVAALDMKPLDKIQIYEVPVDPMILARAKATGHFEDEGGISTLQVISTSHLALHAWPLQSYFAFDGFSCKDYDAERALQIIRNTLGVTTENTLVLLRRKPSLAEQAQVSVYQM